jgi:hypothetical protein
MKNKIHARVATTEAVDKYPGWALSKTVLEDLARRIAGGDVPMRFDHLVQRPIEYANANAQVVQIDGGHYALDVEFEVPTDRWSEIQSAFDAAGVTGGFSFTATVPDRQPTSGDTPVAVIAMDAAAWSEEDRERVRATLEREVPAGSALLFQYSAAIEIATVLLSLSTNVGLAILGNAAYDAIKTLVSGRAKPTRIEIHRTSAGGESLAAVVETADADVAGGSGPAVVASDGPRARVRQRHRNLAIILGQRRGLEFDRPDALGCTAYSARRTRRDGPGGSTVRGRRAHDFASPPRSRGPYRGSPSTGEVAGAPPHPAGRPSYSQAASATSTPVANPATAIAGSTNAGTTSTASAPIATDRRTLQRPVIRRRTSSSPKR